MASPSRRVALQSAIGAATLLGARRGRAFAAAPPTGGVGWREALLVAPRLEPWIEVLSVVGGWEVAHAGGFDVALNALWSLPDSARTRQVLMRNVGAAAGMIRLVEVVGAPQQRIRPHDQAWETGGVQALDLRVIDMETTRRELEARGWRGPSDPVRYKAYGVEVIQWAPSSPDGVRLSFIQRLAPPLKGWAELKRWSRAANAAMTVKDIGASDRFLREALGLELASRTDTVGARGPNVMGLPWRYAASLAIDIRGFKGGSLADGAIELIAMPDAQGRDYADAARPPNFGLAGLRFFVPDVGASLAKLVAARAQAAGGIASLRAEPWGACLAAAARGPDGVWIELLQTGGVGAG